MKFICYIKDNWFSWLVTLIVVFSFIINGEYANRVNSAFLHYSILIIHFTIISTFFLCFSLLIGIEENLWDDFTIGKDYHIDRMMRFLKIIIICSTVSTLLWITVNLYVSMYATVDFSIYKNIFRFIFPIIVTVYLGVDYYKLSKQYYN